jgi:hypothetical protein
MLSAGYNISVIFYSLFARRVSLGLGLSARTEENIFGGDDERRRKKSRCGEESETFFTFASRALFTLNHKIIR